MIPMTSPITTPDWVKDAIFYQIFPDRFARRASYADEYIIQPDNFQTWGAAPTPHSFQGGDLIGAREKLDYLADLGVNAIFFNPIFASASNHRYHTNDYYQVDPLLGGNQALRDFLDAAHGRNMRVILDGVFNHASRGFFQFNHLLECGAESPFVDWFHVQKWPLNAYDERDKPNYAAWWGHRALPKFNTNTTAVREFLWRAATYWLEQGIDGWRLDVPNEIDDDAFWQEFRRCCRAVNSDAYIVGELWQDASRWLQGDQFDAQMNYNFTRLAYGFILGKSMDQTETRKTGYGRMPALSAPRFAAQLDQLFNQTHHPQITLAQMNMLGSHDTPRVWTVARGDATAVRLLFLLQMTVPGAPNIYYGDEIGLPGGGDPDCRRAFPWHNPGQWHNHLRADMQRFIALRRAKAALRRGDFQILHADRGLVVFQRQYAGQTAVIALNASSRRASFTLPAGLVGALPEHLCADDQAVALAAGQTLWVNGRAARVWAD
ncbi:MAG: glycoside hydrolase family 13 protein [Chloroflexi bacterium]|nr:glycoside hydrolase family 13 protein [Chloroflexota bacterium]